MAERHYTIRVAAELTGLHAQSLRMYERRGLIQPRRSPGNIRLFSEADIEQICFIKRLVDELGGLYEAVMKARELAGLPADAAMRIIRKPGKPLPAQLAEQVDPATSCHIQDLGKVRKEPARTDQCRCDRR